MSTDYTKDISKLYTEYWNSGISGQEFQQKIANLIRRAEVAARQTIQTPCPACKLTSLIISADNWLVCGNLECSNPAAINELQAKPTNSKGNV